MSGLANYFRYHLPAGFCQRLENYETNLEDAVVTVTKQKNDSTDNEVNGAVKGAVNDKGNGAANDEIASSSSMKVTALSLKRFNYGTSSNSFGFVGSHGYIKWNKQNREGIRRFMKYRISPQSSTTRNISAARLMHIANTDQVVNHLSDIDLTKQMLQNCNCVVKRLYNIRNTTRKALTNSSRRCFCFDGPLSSAYTHVTSFEVVQWLGGQNDIRLRGQNELQQNTIMCLQGNSRPTGRPRMIVFLYGEWATSLSQVLDRKPASRAPYELLLRLEKVPATCIFPYRALDWTEGDMCSYCICIGDKIPRVEVEKSNVQGEYIRFDNDVCLKFQYSTLKERQGTTQKSETYLFTLKLNESLVSVDHEKEASHLFAVVPRHPLLIETPRLDTKRPRDENESFRPRHEDTVGFYDNDFPSSPSSSSSWYYTLSQLKNELDKQSELENEVFVNVLAIVLGFGAPRRTKRGDWMLTVTIVDSSISENEAIIINMFSKSIERLPVFWGVGNAIRIHRAKVGKYLDDFQLVGLIKTSYVVFRQINSSVNGLRDTARAETLSDGFEYKKFGDCSEVSEDDKTVFQELWIWGQHRISSFPTISAKHVTRISDLLHARDMIGDEVGDRDFALMVRAVIDLQNHASTTGIRPFGLLRVWDGTGPSTSDPLPFPVTPEDAEALRISGDWSSQCLDKLVSICSTDKCSLTLPKYVTGRVSNLVVWEKVQWGYVKSAVTSGSFIRLHNIRESIFHDSGIRCLHVLAASQLSLLPDLAFEAIEIVHAHNTRIENGDLHNPTSGIPPLKPHERHCASSILIQNPDKHQNCRSLKELVDAPVGSIFEGTVQVVSTIPKISTSNAFTIKRLVATDDTESSNHYVWRFAICIDDTSMHLNAIVNNATGESFLKMDALTAISMPEINEAMLNVGYLLQDSRTWRARIRSFAFDGYNFFIVDALAE